MTPSWKQSLLLAVNDAENPAEIALPFTVGTWDITEPVEIELGKGTNALRFTREGEVKGVSIKDFTLTPIRGENEGYKGVLREGKRPSRCKS